MKPCKSHLWVTASTCCKEDSRTYCVVCWLDQPKEFAEVKRIATVLGQLGGQQTAKRGVEFYREIGRKGAKARWLKKQEVAK